MTAETARSALPLAAHPVLHTTDVDQARDSVARSLCPHGLTPLGDAEGFEAVHNLVELGRVSFHYIDYGADVAVTVDAMDFQLVQLPLAGVCTIAAAGRAVTVTPGRAATTAMGEPVRMRYSAGNPRLMVRVAGSLLHERLALAARAGRDWSTAELDVTRGAGRSWRSLVELVIGDLEHGAGLAASPLAARSLEFAVVDGLISAQTATSGEDRREPAAHARIVTRAARLIEEHCAEPLGTRDIAEAVGVSVRMLQAGFRARLDTTPMGYLRQARLDRVRAEPIDGRAASVTEAALRWGISHLGRFSGDYRAAFGESPSQTFRRAH